MKETAGSATDNEADVLNMFVSEMKKQFPGFVGAGCTYHFLNLIFLNAYHSTFEKLYMGFDKVLHIDFMVSYLMSKEPGKWKAFAIRHGRGANRSPTSMARREIGDTH